MSYISNSLNHPAGSLLITLSGFYGVQMALDNASIILQELTMSNISCLSRTCKTILAAFRKAESDIYIAFHRLRKDTHLGGYYVVHEVLFHSVMCTYADGKPAHDIRLILEILNIGMFMIVPRLILSNDRTEDHQIDIEPPLPSEFVYKHLGDQMHIGTCKTNDRLFEIDDQGAMVIRLCRRPPSTIVLDRTIYKFLI